MFCSGFRDLDREKGNGAMLIASTLPTLRLENDYISSKCVMTPVY